MGRWLAGGVVATCLVSLGAPSVATGHRAIPGADVLDPWGTGPGSHRLHAVEDVSADDGWAAGEFRGSQQLIKHYDGRVWNSRVGPDQKDGSPLDDFQSFGTSDVWVVGEAGQLSFVGHWDGYRWRQVDSPNPRSVNGLSGVSGVAPDDVWAVGASADGGWMTVADHWDGRSWTQVPTPNQTSNDKLVGVHAIASHDVWAVGGTYNTPMIEHWDGSSWSLVDQPAPAGELTSVVGFASDDVWAVGHVWAWVEGVRQTTPLLEHWDGTAWSLVEDLHMGALGSLNALSGTSSSDVWAVGCTLRDERYGHLTVIEHYDGTRWTRIKSPNPEPYATQCLLGVSAASPTEAWAVGTYGYNDEDLGMTHNLLAHWDGTSWTWDRSPRHSS